MTNEELKPLIKKMLAPDEKILFNEFNEELMNVIVTKFNCGINFHVSSKNVNETYETTLKLLRELRKEVENP